MGELKIGILTYHAAHNYGAMLQAYALSTYLASAYRAEVAFVNYLPAESSSAYGLFVPLRDIGALKKNLNSLLHYCSLAARQKGFTDFHRKYFRLTQRYRTNDELKQTKPGVDVYITGSDQVFRYKGPISDPYYLAFCEKGSGLAVAYAPSFGTAAVDGRYKARVAELLSRFDHLSCREKEGAELIRELSGRAVPVVLDPVFLLDEQQWYTLSQPADTRGKYILIYALVGFEGQLAIAKKVQALTGMPIYAIHSRKMRDAAVKKTYTYASPEQFLGLFAGADFVVTDSFHGTAFSLIFRKNFMVHIAIEKSAGRIRDLLNNLELDNRIVEADTTITNTSLEIDYERSEQLLQTAVDESQNYLKKALKMDNGGL